MINNMKSTRLRIMVLRLEARYERILLNYISLAFLGGDKIGQSRRFELLSQAVDVNVKRILINQAVLVPELFHELSPGHDLRLVLQEHR